MTSRIYTGDDAADRLILIEALDAACGNGVPDSFEANREWSEWVACGQRGSRSGLLRTLWRYARFIAFPAIEIVRSNRGERPLDACISAVFFSFFYAILAFLPVMAFIQIFHVYGLLIVLAWLLVQCLILGVSVIRRLARRGRSVPMLREHPRSRCRVCLYHLEGLTPAFEDAPRVGAARCPECGEPWPGLA